MFCNSNFTRIKSTPWKSGFSTRGYLAISGDIFGCHNWGIAFGIWWIEARYAAKFPIGTGQPFSTKNCLFQSVSGV